MGKILPQKFFERATVTVARDLLGKYLCRRRGRKIVRAVITEVEAYDGFEDRASHAHRGKTKRNSVMFGPAGYWYVYFTYGMHWMLNIVTGKEGYPAAILIRSCELVNSKLETLNSKQRTRINGPGRVTKFMKIDGKLNGKRASRVAHLWIAAPSDKERASLRKQFGAGKLKIKSSPRIGVAYAGPVWSKKHYRFYIIHNRLDEN